MTGVKGKKALGKNKDNDKGKEKKSRDSKPSVWRMESGGEEGDLTIAKAIQNLGRDT